MFLFVLSPMLPAEISVPRCPNNESAWFDPLEAQPSPIPAPVCYVDNSSLFKRQQSQFCPLAPLGWLLQCVARVPGGDPKSPSIAGAAAFTLQLPSAVPEATVALRSSTLCVPWKWYSSSLLAFYQNSLGQRLGFKPSGRGQSLVYVTDHALISESGIPLSLNQLPHLHLSFPWEGFFLRSQISHVNSALWGLSCCLFLQTSLEMSESSGEFSLGSLDTLSLLAVLLVSLEPYHLPLSASICAQKCQILWISSLRPSLSSRCHLGSGSRRQGQDMSIWTETSQRVQLGFSW